MNPNFQENYKNKIKDQFKQIQVKDFYLTYKLKVSTKSMIIKEKGLNFGELLIKSLNRFGTTK